MTFEIIIIDTTQIVTMQQTGLVLLISLLVADVPGSLVGLVEAGKLVHERAANGGECATPLPGRLVNFSCSLDLAKTFT